MMARGLDFTQLMSPAHRNIIIALAFLVCAVPSLAQTSRDDVDRQRKAWRSAVAQLQARPDVQALRLTALQLEALTAAVVETAPFDLEATARRIRAVRRDPDASAAVVAAWTRAQDLYQRLDAQKPPQEDTLRAITVTHLTAQAIAAIARTEPATVGGRVPSENGRTRAGQLAERARAILPDSPHVQLLAGDLLLDAEQPEAAEEWYRKALAGEGSAAAHLKLAEVLRLQGQLDAAILEVREALKIDPKSAVAHTDLALILRQQGKDDEGIEEYREAIRLDRDWSDAHNGLAVALAGQGRTEQAVDEFREIIRIDPDSTIGYYNLATALANLDRDVEAAEALRHVIRIYPNHYNARFNLGELFRLEGKYDESAKQFREYVRLAPDTQQNQRNLRRARQYVQQFEN